jgi:hypothetical protein
MIKHEGFPSFAEQKATETLEKQAYALAEAIAAVAPESSAANPLEIFPQPGERRADTEFSLPPHQGNAFREAMAKLGIGRETNLSATEVGLKDGYVAVIEGGQAHKILAELNIVLADKTTRPSSIIIAATPERAIPEPEVDKAKEKETTAKVLGVEIDQVAATEYDVAQQIIYKKLPGLQPQSVSVLDFGYDMDGRVYTGEATGQFKRMGSINHAIPVYLLRVDREYTDPSNPKQYKTLGVRNLIKVVAGVLRHNGENADENADIGFVTSATYQPSREIDAASAMIEIERLGESRNVGVITYGTQELAKVKKEQVPQPPALGQLAGEAHKAAVEVSILRDLLAQKQQEAEAESIVVEPERVDMSKNRIRWDVSPQEIEAMDETQLRQFLIETNQRINGLHEAVKIVLSGYSITKVLTMSEIQAAHDALDPGGPSYVDDINQD